MLFPRICPKNSIFAVILLALGLLWAQNYLFNHALEHQLEVQDHEHESAQLCNICAIAHYSQDGVASTQISTYQSHVELFSILPIAVTLIFITLFYLRPNPRAPPVISN